MDSVLRAFYAQDACEEACAVKPTRSVSQESPARGPGMAWSPASVEASLACPSGVCVLTYQTLDAQAIVETVRNDAAGAIAVFIGK